jgi:hypothetical protein
MLIPGNEVLGPSAMSVWTLRLRIVREIKQRRADDASNSGMSPVLFSPVITARGVVREREQLRSPIW